MTIFLFSTGGSVSSIGSICPIGFLDCREGYRYARVYICLAQFVQVAGDFGLLGGLRLAFCAYFWFGFAGLLWDILKQSGFGQLDAR